jgi:hypothetical protein
MDGGQRPSREQVHASTEPVALYCTWMRTDKSGDEKGFAWPVANFQPWNSFFFLIYTKKCLTFAGGR